MAVFNNDFRLIAKDRARMTVSCQQNLSQGAPMRCRLHVTVKNTSHSADLEMDVDLPDSMTTPGSALSCRGLSELIVDRRHYDADQQLCLVFCHICTVPAFDLIDLQKNGWIVSGNG